MDKHTLRQQIRAKRKALPEAVVRQASAAVCARAATLPQCHAAASVITYIPSENEICTAELVSQAAAAGRELFLPRMLEQPSLVRWNHNDPLVRGRFGVLEPQATPAAAPAPPAIAFLPLVAWDVSGTRLGRGMGFFDRLLAHLQPLPLCIGLAYEFQEIPELPRDPWDVPLQFVITEERIVHCDANQSASSEKGGWQQ